MNREQTEYLLPKDLTTTLSMSSQEIAGLTGKRPDSVLRDFRDVCEALELDPHSFVEKFPGINGDDTAAALWYANEFPKDSEKLVTN